MAAVGRSMSAYLTDGARLYEVVAEEIVHNHGLGPSLIRYVAVEDCSTGERQLLIGERIVRYQPIR
jgi:hypothetical protein